MKELNERQRCFVDAYIQCGNASESVRRAGYKTNAADVTATKLMRNERVKREIQNRLDELHNERTADLQETLEFTTSVMRGEILDNVVVNVGTGRGYTQPRIFEIPTPLQQRLKAAEFILKVNGAFQQSKADETKVPDTIKIICADHSKGGDENYEN